MLGAHDESCTCEYPKIDRIACPWLMLAISTGILNSYTCLRTKWQVAEQTLQSPPTSLASVVSCRRALQFRRVSPEVWSPDVDSRDWRCWCGADTAELIWRRRHPGCWLSDRIRRVPDDQEMLKRTGHIRRALRLVCAPPAGCMVSQVNTWRGPVD
jgi:hypothetical protein